MRARPVVTVLVFFPLATLLVLITLCPGNAAAQASGPVEPPSIRYDVPKPQALFLLLRTTMVALDQANKTGNYTVLRDWAAPSFRDRNTAARLSEIFAHLRKSRADLATTSIVTPELSSPPAVNKQNQLLLEGHFPTLPLHVKFETSVVPVNGHWRLLGLSVGLRPSSAQKTSK